MFSGWFGGPQSKEQQEMRKQYHRMEKEKKKSKGEDWQDDPDRKKKKNEFERLNRLFHLQQGIDVLENRKAGRAGGSFTSRDAQKLEKYKEEMASGRMQKAMGEFRQRAGNSFATGGIPVPGTGSGDTVSGMFPPGTLIMNRNAEQKMRGFAMGGIPAMVEPGEGVYPPGSWGPGHLAMNSMYPRFQGGGVTQYLTGDRSHAKYRADHGGKNYHEHFGFASTADRDAAIAYLEGQGFYIGSRNDGQHAVGSLHYQDRAFDVPFYPNHTRFGYSNDREGEEKFSADVRKAMKKGGFPVGGGGGGGGGYYHAGPISGAGGPGGGGGDSPRGSAANPGVTYTGGGGSATVAGTSPGQDGHAINPGAGGAGLVVIRYAV